MIKIGLNNVGKTEKVFWVNLVPQEIHYASLTIKKFQASIIDEYIFGKKSPTNISLPEHKPEIEFIYNFRNYEETIVSKHNYNSRRSSRLNKLFHTKYKLNTQYLTIFL